MSATIDLSSMGRSQESPGIQTYVVPVPLSAAVTPVIDVSDDPGVVAAQEAVTLAERAHEALNGRLATDTTITAAQLRATEDGLTLARRRLVAAERHAVEGRKALLRERLTQLHQRARRLAGNAPQRIKEAQRLHMARDEADRGISADNAEAHAISEDGAALQAEAGRLGLDLNAIARELGVGGVEWHSHRLLGGVKVGEYEIPKHQQPIILGGYDPGLVARVAPPPPPVVIGNSCTDVDGRTFKSHVTTWMDDSAVSAYYRNGLRCERCKRQWTAAEAKAEWGMVYEPQRTQERTESLGAVYGDRLPRGR